MKKYDLSGCSIILPVGIDFAERLEHVNFLLKYFPRFFTNYELIVVEQGKDPKIALPPKSDIKYIFVKSDSEFSTSRISNTGALLVTNPFIIKIDADVFIHPKAIYDALEKLKNNADKSFIFPYNGVSFTITNPLRKLLMASFEYKSLPYVSMKDSERFRAPCLTLKNMNSSGLIHLFRTSVFKALGGYNEEFLGWGYEDNEIVDRFNILGSPRELLEGYNAFHFDHPRKSGDRTQVIKNYYLARAVKELTPELLKEYVKTWSRF